jgi:hypothetical protein
VNQSTEPAEDLYAKLQSKIQDCITWSEPRDENYKQTAEGFRDQFKVNMHTALKDKKIDELKSFTRLVDEFITKNNIPLTPHGGRRRKSSSSSRPRRRSSKKRGTQRKQKRRQRCGSRRA